MVTVEGSPGLVGSFWLGLAPQVMPGYHKANQADDQMCK